MSGVLLQVDNLVKHYTLPRQRLLAPPPVVQALQGVSFQLRAGHSLGVVGESGSGKSTLARLVMALEAPTAGTVRLAGQDLHALGPAALRQARAGFQMVFQDPFGSLDPRQTVGRIISDGPVANGVPRAQVATDLAVIYLMDRKPEQALQAINSSRTTILPTASATLMRVRP